MEFGAARVSRFGDFQAYNAMLDRLHRDGMTCQHKRLALKLRTVDTWRALFGTAE